VDLCATLLPTVEEVAFAGAITSNHNIVALVEWFHHRLVLVTLEALYNNLEFRGGFKTSGVQRAARRLASSLTHLLDVHFIIVDSDFAQNRALFVYNKYINNIDSGTDLSMFSVSSYIDMPFEMRVDEKILKICVQVVQSGNSGVKYSIELRRTIGLCVLWNVQCLYRIAMVDEHWWSLGLALLVLLNHFILWRLPLHYNITQLEVATVGMCFSTIFALNAIQEQLDAVAS